MAQVKPWLRIAIFAIAALIVSIALLAALNARAYAAQDISDYVVTDFTASSSTIGNNTQVSFDLKFSEDDTAGNLIHNIEDGDTITISWPTSSMPSDLGFYLVGYNNTHDLEFTPEGELTPVTVGQVVISDNGAVITFNSSVENYQHVKGTLTFSATAHNTGNPTSGTTDTLQITSGTKSVDLTVRQQGGGGVGTGLISKNIRYFNNDVSTKTAEWGIGLNQTYSPNLTGTVTVTDVISEKLDPPEFVRVWAHYKDDEGTVHTWRYDSESEFENSMGANFSYDSASRTLTVTIPASSLSNFEVDGATHPVWLEMYFNTKWNSNTPGGETIGNTAYVSYYTSATQTDPTQGHAYASVWVPRSGAEVTGVPHGTLELTKVVDGTATPIKGVTFRVYKLTGDGGTHVSGWYQNPDGSMSDYVDIITGPDGIAALTNLQDGYYEIEEVGGPEWVVRTTQKVQAHLTETAGVAQKIENKVASGDITATKSWLSSDGTDDTSEHPTIYFKLYRATGNEEPVAVENAPLKELSNGTTTVTWEGLNLYDNEGNKYTYSVKEVDADGNDYVPDGYSKQENGLTVTNTKTPPLSSFAKMPKTGDGLFLPVTLIFAVAMTAIGISLMAQRKSEKHEE